MNRRIFVRSAALMAVASSGVSAWIRARQSPLHGNPFSWRDAENRSAVWRATVAEDGQAVALQVSRPLSAGGEFYGPGWTSMVDSRADLWLLDGRLQNARRLSELQGGAWSPSFSPDGRRLAALTLVKPGKVGIVVWEQTEGRYRIFPDPNVEVLLAKFRTAGSAYATPTTFIQVPRQYFWLDETSIVFVDHGSEPQQSVLAVASLSPTIRALRQRTDKGERSVRVWDSQSPTCGVGSCLTKISCESGERTVLYRGDIRGVSLSPDRRWVALVVATSNLRPAPGKPMQWDLSATTPFDDSMVRWKLALLDLAGHGSARDIGGIEGVGNVAPSRLPLWAVDSSRVAISVRMTDSDDPSTGDDAAWQVEVKTGVTHRWTASSALDAELLAALVTTDGLDTSRVIDGRPQKIRRADYAAVGQILGGAWRCAPGLVMFWNRPALTLISPTATVTIPGQFSSVQPPVSNDTASGTVAVRANRTTALISVSAAEASYHVDGLSTDPKWQLLAINSRNFSLIYKDERENGTFLMLAGRSARPVESPLMFNTYFRNVIRPQRRVLTHTFPDGSVRRGLLQLPVGHRAGDRYPVVVWAYPNSEPSPDNSLTRGNSFTSVIYPVQYLLTQGFAFFQAPFPIRGTLSEQPMRAAVDAVVPWLDVLDRQPDIIPGEYGYFGHSNAGYVALALEASTSRFKAIVAWDTFPDIGFDVLHSTAGDVALSCAPNLIQSSRRVYEDPTQPYTPRPAPPWKDPARYIRSDPLFNLGRASTPMLLVEGELDFDPREMEQVFSILYGRGIPVELAYYWGEYHYFMSPGNILDSWLRTEKFFRRYLRAR